MLGLEELAKEYLKFCIDYDNSVANTKFVLGKMYKYNGDNLMNKKFNREFEAAESLVQISRFWNMKDYCQEKHAQYEAKGLVHLRCSPITRLEDVPNEILEYRKSFYDDDNITFVLMRFQRKYFGLDTLPKVLLHGYAGRNKIPFPTYETRREDRLYYSVVTFNGTKFSSLIWSREAKSAEQAAALVVCHHLGLFQTHFLTVIGCLLDKIPDDISELKAESI